MSRLLRGDQDLLAARLPAEVFEQGLGITEGQLPVVAGIDRLEAGIGVVLVRVDRNRQPAAEGTVWERPAV